MIVVMKKLALLAFWFIPLALLLSRWMDGRLYVFRDASNELLRFVWLIYLNPRAQADDEMASFFRQAMDEVKTREQTGRWHRRNQC